MSRMGFTIDEYAEQGGWSSHHFAERAVLLMGDLIRHGVDVKIGRSVIHITKAGKKLKAYPHYNGRTEEYATITDHRGAELLTVHFTEFDKLELFILGELNEQG